MASSFSSIPFVLNMVFFHLVLSTATTPMTPFAFLFLSVVVVVVLAIMLKIPPMMTWLTSLSMSMGSVASPLLMETFPCFCVACLPIIGIGASRTFANPTTISLSTTCPYIFPCLPPTCKGGVNVPPKSLPTGFVHQLFPSTLETNLFTNKSRSQSLPVPLPANRPFIVHGLPRRQNTFIRIDTQRARDKIWQENVERHHE